MRISVIALLVGVLTSLPLFPQKPIVLNKELLNGETLEPIIQGFRWCNVYDDQRVAVNYGSHWELLDYSGQKLIDRQFKSEPTYYDGLMAVRVTSPANSFDQYEVFDDNHNSLFQFKASSLDRFYGDFAAFVSSGNRRYGLIDKTGKVVIEDIYNGHNGSVEIDGKSYFIFKKGENMGVVDISNSEVLAFEYHEIEWLTRDIFRLEYVNPTDPYHISTNPFSKGQKIPNYLFRLWSPSRGFIADEYDIILSEGAALKDGYFEVSKENTWGLIDQAGKEIIPTEHDRVKYITGGLIAVAYRKPEDEYPLFAISDQSGNKQTDYILSAVGEYHNGLFSASIIRDSQLKHGFLDKELSIVIPFEYNSVRTFGDFGLAIAGNYDKRGAISQSFGVINMKNEVIIPLKFDQVVRVSPDYFKVKMEDDSIEYLVHAKSGSPVQKTANLFRVFGQHYFEQENYKMAVVYLEDMYKSGEATDQDLYAYGSSLARDNGLDKGMEVLRFAESNYSGDKTGLLSKIRAEQAFIHSKKGENDEAERLYLDIISSLEENGDIRLQLAEFYENLEKFAQAEVQYQEIIKRFPKASFVYEKLGLVQAQQDKNDLAITTLSKGIELNPNSMNSYYYRGQLYIQTNNAPGAIQDFTKAIEIQNQGLSGIHIHLADAYFQNNQKGKACELWKSLAQYDQEVKTKHEEHCK